MELIYNINEIKEILIDFHNLTKFRIALFDKDFNELLSYPTRLSNYCKIIRSEPILNTACNNCDYISFSKCKKTQSPVMYECHAGLTELIVPIKSSGTTIGYIMSGQLRNTDSAFNWNTILENFSKYNLDFKTLKNSYNFRPQLSDHIIKSALNILTICADYLNQCNKIKPKKDSLAYRLDAYIKANLTEDIDVNILCEEFNYKKTNFYKVTNELYGMPIMKRIRQLRIQPAKLLLSNTALSISEISASVGIYDYNYFTKIFKAEVNCTPREFRMNSFSSFSNASK